MQGTRVCLWYSPAPLTADTSWSRWKLSIVFTILNSQDLPFCLTTVWQMSSDRGHTFPHLLVLPFTYCILAKISEGYSKAYKRSFQLEAGLTIFSCSQSTLCFPTAIQQSLMLGMTVTKRLILTDRNHPLPLLSRDGCLTWFQSYRW